MTSLVKRHGEVLALDGCSVQVLAGDLVGLPGSLSIETATRTLDIERVDLALDVAGAGSLPELIEEGRFRVPVQQVFPMTQAAEAHAAVRRGPRQGKIALTAHGDHH